MYISIREYEEEDLKEASEEGKEENEETEQRPNEAHQLLEQIEIKTEAKH